MVISVVGWFRAVEKTPLVISVWSQERLFPNKTNMHKVESGTGLS